MNKRQAKNIEREIINDASLNGSFNMVEWLYKNGYEIIKGIAEQRIWPDEKLVNKILKIGLDFGRVYCNELPQSWADIAEKEKKKAKTKIRKLLRETK